LAGLLIVFGFLFTSARAATITFGTAATVSADADVFTKGTFAYGYNWSNTSTTVNGVTFTGTNSSTGGGTDVSFSATGGLANNPTVFATGSGSPWNGLSTSYKTLLTGGDYSTSAPTTTTLSNLTVGQVYAVQLWVNDNRAGGVATRTQTVTSGGSGNTVTLDYNSTDAAGGVGQYTIGYFTANATTQTFTLTASSGTVAQINALQVRSAQPFWSGQTNGNWDTSTGNWTGGQSYSALTAASVTSLTFGDADGFGNTVTNKTLTVSSGLTAGSLTFQNTTAGGTYTLNGGSLTLSGGITKSGTGAVSIGTALALAAGTHTVNVSDTTTALTVSGVISGTGAISKTGTGTLILSGANTYSGGTTIGNNTGIVRISNGSALGTGAVNLTKVSTSTSGTLELTNNITVANNFNFASTNSDSAAQILNVSGNNTLSGALNVTSTGGNGAIIESAGGFLTVSGDFSTNQTGTRMLQLSGASDGLFSGAINETASHPIFFIKDGAGTWTVTGASTATGSYSVRGGVLNIQNSAALGTTRRLRAPRCPVARRWRWKVASRSARRR